ncbi:hypothetical protein HDV00_001497 [Rhizophlyctis rosea]|nr:hypothetical protein HDV00_001497 [Rhizophlyctis rosea]
MGKSASDYILRVRAGPSYDPAKLTTVYVNDEHNPVLIDTEHFTGYLVVRVLNFNGITPDNKPVIPNPSSNYFHGRNRRYSVMIQGRFKKDWNGDEIIFGTDFDTRVRTPTGAGLAIKIAKWLDPALDADLNCEKPWLYTPWVSAMNALAVFPPDSPEIRNPSSKSHSQSIQENGTTKPCKNNRISPSSDTSAVVTQLSQLTMQNSTSTLLSQQQQPSTDIGLWSFHSRMVPEETTLLFPSTSKTPPPHLASYEKRKKHFGVSQTRGEVTIRADKVYAMDFYDAYLDFSTLMLKLPGFSVNALRYWDGQPLRFVCRTRGKGAGAGAGKGAGGGGGGAGGDSTVFFVVMFELIEREGVVHHHYHKKGGEEEEDVGSSSESSVGSEGEEVFFDGVEDNP